MILRYFRGEEDNTPVNYVMSITKYLYIALKLYPFKIVTIAIVTIFNLQLFK